jgi:hypothetical protein
MPGPDEISRRIRHAEQWLRWARSDCRRGEPRSAVLRLLLAEAEIRRAREDGMDVPEAPVRPTRRIRPAVAGVAAALVIAAAGYAVVRSGDLQAPVAAGQSSRVIEVATVARGPRAATPFTTERYLTLALPVPGPGDAGPSAGPEAWQLQELPGRFSDDLSSRFGGVTLVGPHSQAGFATSGDPKHPSPTF